MYVKQQQHLTGSATGPSDIFKHESINAMQSNFADLVIKDSQVVSLFSFVSFIILLSVVFGILKESAAVKTESMETASCR